MASLLLLHGFTGAPESWGEVVASLSSEVEAYRPAIVGHDPDRSVPSATFEDEVDRLAGLVRAAGAHDVHVAGYSQGGRLALGLLVRHPDLFAAATLVGASPGLADEEKRRQRRASDERLARLLEDEGLEYFLGHWEALPLFASQEGLPASRLDTQRALRRRHRAAELARALRVLGLGRMPNYWPDLRRLDVPVRLMVGELDVKFRGIAERMARELPRATIETVPSVGHNLLLEAPERVAASL